MRAGDTLAAARRALPWLRIEKSYVFDTARGRRTLPELFDSGSQLIVHHLMFAPEWEAACPGCSFQAEHIDGPARHLKHHNVKIVAVSMSTAMTRIFLRYFLNSSWCSQTRRLVV